MKKIIWKPIKGFESLYRISNDGQVMTIKRSYWCATGHSVMKTNPSKLMSPGIVKGYKSVALYKNKKAKYITIHRLVALHFIPNPYNKPQVNHKDTNKLNNHYKNLEWCTGKENQQHALENNLLGMCGEKNHGTHLKNKDVRKMRKIFASHNLKSTREIKTQLREKYNVSIGVLDGILSYRSWKRI